jgi:hypothetical protein
MGKQADIEPRWLVSLMCQWARRQTDLEDGSLGFPSKAAFLTIGRATNARTDPTEFCARDFQELEAALKDCLTHAPDLWAALMMYYKPWTVTALQGEGWPFANSTYYYRLHAAHRRVSQYIQDHAVKPEPEWVVA